MNYNASASWFFRLNRLVGKCILFFAEWILERFYISANSNIDQKQFDWINTLEEHSSFITNEFVNYTKLGTQIPAIANISYGQKSIEVENKWHSLFLIAFNREIKSNTCHFPTTMSKLKMIPGLNTAFFSILRPGAHISPHRGLYKGLLRCHLAIILPKEIHSCGLVINKHTYHWQLGKAFVFDDTLTHSAYNNTKEDRVVLLIDFERPIHGWYCKVNKLLLLLISRSPYIQTLIQNLNRI
jgi:beta-hydroxylase